MIKGQSNQGNITITNIYAPNTETFSRIDHILFPKTSINKLKNTEVLSCIFSNDNGLTLEINYKKK